jgi:PAS domain S-box-containing protein
VRDLSKRKRLKDLLRSLSEEYNFLFDSNPHPLWIIDADSLRFLAVNEAALKLYGYSREEFLAMNIKDIRPREDRPAVVQASVGLIPGLSYMGQWRHYKKDRTLIDVEISSYTIILAEKEVRLVQGKDLTNEHRTEEAFRQSQERFAQVFHASPVSIIISTLADKRFVDVNEAFLQLCGYAKNEMIGRTANNLGLWTNPSAYDRLIKSVREHGSVKNVETNLLTKSAEIRECLISIELIHLDGADCLLITLLDLTERLQAERMLQQSRASLANAQRLARLGNWERDLKTNVVTWSDELYRVFGIERESFGKSFDTFMAFVHPDDQARVEAILNRAIAEGGSFDSYYRIYTPDGTLKFIQERGDVIVEGGESVRLVGTAQDVTELKQAEEASRKFEERYRTVSRATNDVIWDWDLVTNEVEWNDTLYEAFRYEKGMCVNTSQWWYDHIHPEDRDRVVIGIHTVIDSGEQYWMDEYRFERGDGSYAFVYDRGFVIHNERGTSVRMIGSMLDLTERRRAEEALRESEEKLRQSQKMESIGRLAGGIAHDFNNLLTAIIGYSDLTIEALRENDPLQKNILEIRKASERAAELTHKLLAFSRRQMLQPRVIDLNMVVSDMDRILRRLLGEDVDLITQLDPEVGKVKADPGQIEQVIINLAVNARDAMPVGGKLLIETSNVELDAYYALNNSDATPGSYVLMTFSDNGTGMDEATMENIFEPFFTTKEVGKGTGLGLATVYGIVRQSEGHIHVDSEVDRGTTFRIYLPRVTEEAEIIRASAPVQNDYYGTETILLAEDDEIVRKMAQMILEKNGYKVLTAANGHEALLIFEQYKGPIDLLLTDVVMPKMSGYTLAERLTAFRPEMLVLYMSGYAEDAISRHRTMNEANNFIEKPFTLEALARKMRRVLDSVRKR